MSCINLKIYTNIITWTFSILQIFFGVFIFGVFQGLVFLPVILSILGPPSYSEGLSESNKETSLPLEKHNGTPTQSLSIYSSEVVQQWELKEKYRNMEP